MHFWLTVHIRAIKTKIETTEYLSSGLGKELFSLAIVCIYVRGVSDTNADASRR